MNIMNYIRKVLFLPSLSTIDVIILLIVASTLSLFPALIVWSVYSIFLSRRIALFMLPQSCKTEQPTNNSQSPD